MHAALLALLLVGFTVDARLAEPMRLLAEVTDRDGRTVGLFYARVPEALSLILAVRQLPDGEDARYDRGRRTVTVAESVLAEDPRIVAVVLTHELRHSADLEWVAQGAVTLDCLEIEARAFWPDELPSATQTKRDLASWVRTYEAGDVTAVQARVAKVPFYQQRCTV